MLYIFVNGIFDGKMQQNMNIIYKNLEQKEKNYNTKKILDTQSKIANNL